MKTIYYISYPNVSLIEAYKRIPKEMDKVIGMKIPHITLHKGYPDVIQHYYELHPGSEYGIFEYIYYHPDKETSSDWQELDKDFEPK